MAKFLLPFWLLLMSLSVFAQSGIPLWKSFYDSASLYSKQNSNRSVVLLGKAEKIARDDLGIYDENYLVILNALGLAYSYAGEDERAKIYLEQAVAAAKEVYKSDDPRLLRSTVNLANVIAGAGERKEALTLFNNAYNISLRKGDHEIMAMAATGKLRSLEADQQLDSALALARNVHRSATLKKQLNIAYDFTLAEGRLLRKMRKFNAADSVLIPLEKQLSLKGMSYRPLRQAAIIQLRLLDIETGKYSKAEKELFEFYRIVKNEADTDPGVVVEVANALAQVYEKLGVFSKAILYYQESFDYCASAFGRTSSTCAVLQNNISGLYLKQGKFDDAIKGYQTYIDTFEGVEGKERSINYLAALNNIATAYRQNNEYERALESFQQLLSVIEQDQSSDFAAIVMANTAVTLTLTGKYDRAVEYFSKALSIKEKIYGNASPMLLDITSNFGSALWLSGKKAESLPLFQRSLELGLREVRYNFQNLTETEQVQFYERQKENFERFNTLAVQSNAPSQLVVQMFNNQLLLKSIVFFSGRNLADILRNVKDPTLKKIVEEKQSKLTSLGHYYQVPVEELERLHISLRKIESQVDSLDKLIHHRLQRNSPEKGSVTWTDVQASLGPDEVSVDIVRFRKYDSRVDNVSNKVRVGFSDSVYYAALITTAETRSAPQLLLLRNGNQLETRFLSYYRNATKFDFKDSISTRQFWQPIESRLGNKTKVYLTPDGVFRQVNLNTMRSKSGRFVIEDYQLHELLNPAAIVSKSEETLVNITSVVLMGDPVFGVDQALVGAASVPEWSDLPGTAQEVSAIEKLLGSSTKVTRFTKLQASESNLRNVKSPSVLHIATHGFFSIDVAYLNDQVKSSHLFHSGLLLSADPSTQVRSTQNDGIVTAYDILGLDLSNTDLVVLSACETGLGKNEYGEGMYGLQRSFMQAGAKGVVISLWKVDDNATRDLMILFYTNLRKTRDQDTALRAAQLELMGRTPNPRLWGAFVTASSD